MTEINMAPILGQSRVRYEALDRLVPKYEAVTGTVDVFLDVRSVFGVYFNDRFKEASASCPAAKRMLLSAELLNMVGHYRHYFWSRRELPTRFVLVHSPQASRRCKELFPEYKSEYEESRSRTGPYPENAAMVEDNLEIVGILAKRIPDTAFIDTGTVEPDCIPQMMKDPDRVALCLSNNPSWAQHACFPMMNLLTLKGDKSQLVRFGGVMDYLTKGAHTRSMDIRAAAAVPYRLAEWVLAIGGSSKHSVPGWKGFGAIKAMNYLSKRDLMGSDFYDVDSMAEDMTEAGIVQDRIDLARTFFDVLSVRRNAESVTEAEGAAIEAQTRCDPDMNSLQDANAEYFGALPLRLGFLFEGCER